MEWEWGWGKERWDDCEIRFDIYTLPYIKQITSGKQLYSTGSSAKCSVMT